MFDKEKIKNLLEFTLKTVEEVEKDEPDSMFLDYGLCSVWHDLNRDGRMSSADVQMLIEYLDSKKDEIDIYSQGEEDPTAENSFFWQPGEWEPRKVWLRNELKRL